MAGRDRACAYITFHFKPGLPSAGKEYGMNSGIPFIKIADRDEVTVDLKGKRMSGPPPEEETNLFNKALSVCDMFLLKRISRQQRFATSGRRSRQKGKNP